MDPVSPSLRKATIVDLPKTNRKISNDRFHGRSRELRPVREHLDLGRARIVTLKGPWIGKTRLPMKFWFDGRTDWPGGIWAQPRVCSFSSRDAGVAPGSVPPPTPRKRPAR